MRRYTATLTIVAVVAVIAVSVMMTVDHGQLFKGANSNLSKAGATQEPAAQRAQPVTDIDLQYCFKIALKQAEPDEKRCPGFLIDELSEAQEICTEVEGKLEPHDRASIWAIDVDGDGKSEYLFDLNSNVTCDGAFSIFGCGSLGCPQILYGQRDGVWHGLGAIHVMPEYHVVEVLTSEGKAGYRDLRVNCARQDECGEIAYYRWSGTEYQHTESYVGGFRVDVAGSAHGLWELARKTDILDTPEPDGDVLETYDAGQVVAILGDVRGTPYYYVSPCRACASGFILKSVLREK